MFYYFYFCLSTTENKKWLFRFSLFRLIACIEFIYKIKKNDEAIMKKLGLTFLKKSKCLLNITSGIICTNIVEQY